MLRAPGSVSWTAVFVFCSRTTFSLSWPGSVRGSASASDSVSDFESEPVPVLSLSANEAAHPCRRSRLNR